MLERSLRASLASMPLVLAVLAGLLATFKGTLPVDIVIVALWGMAFGASSLGRRGSRAPFPTKLKARGVCLSRRYSSPS